MKNSKFAILLMAGMMGASIFSSCGGEDKSEKVKSFATDLAGKIAKNQKDSVLLIYPDAAKGDSLYLSFIPDSIAVQESETPGLYQVTLSPAASLQVEMAEDGTMSVKESKGLFAYKKEDVEMAKNLGVYKEGLNDVQLAERMKELPAVLEFATKNVAKNFKSCLKVSGKTIKQAMFGMDSGLDRFTVKNNSDIEIPASAYKLTYRWFWMHMGVQDSGTQSVAGKTIKPGGSVSFDAGCSGHGGNNLNSGRIVWLWSDEEINKKFFKPTGKEYDEYQASKANTAKAE